MKENIKKYSILLGIIVALVLLDQYTKYYIVHSIGKHKTKTFIKEIISFEYLENDGVAFSFMSGKTLFINLLVLIMVMILLACIYALQNSMKKTISANLKRRFTAMQILLSCMIAGAIGNLIDRVRLGYVVDFIKTDFMDFPIFNVADCYVTVSVFIIFVILILMKEDDFRKITFRR